MFLKVKSILWEHRYKYKTLLYNKGKVTCERRKKAAGWLKTRAQQKMGEDWELSLSWILSCKTCLLRDNKNFQRKRKRFIL